MTDKGTTLRDRLAAAFEEAAASPDWFRVDDIFDTLMWSSADEVTPPTAFGRLWDEPTYRRLVFVSIARAPESRSWSVVIRRSNAPWSPTNERQVSLTHAISILKNPESLWT